MDILSHGLWAALAAKGVSLRSREPLVRPWWAFWWGVFPDLFAFGIPLAALFIMILFGSWTWQDWPGRPGHAMEPISPNGAPLLQLAAHLYQWSHSFIIFAVTVLFVRIVTRQIPWAMFGWMLHILLDIPTHDYRFYPTPFLWPLSTYRFDGFSWAQTWFIVLNYSLLVVGFLAVWFVGRKRKKREAETLSAQRL